MVRQSWRKRSCSCSLSGDRKYFHYQAPIPCLMFAHHHFSQQSADSRFLVAGRKSTALIPPSLHPATESQQSEKRPAERSLSTTPTQARSTSRSKPCKHSKAFPSKQRPSSSRFTTPLAFHTSRMNWIDTYVGKKPRSGLEMR